MQKLGVNRALWWAIVLASFISGHEVTASFPACELARIFNARNQTFAAFNGDSPEETSNKILRSSGLPSENIESNKRLVVVGDVHGALDGLLEVLYHAGITADSTHCKWVQQAVPTLFIQVGDIVDRGPKALEALNCMRSLQENAGKFNAEVVRLLGNHELWWLEGLVHKRNQVTDTREKIMKIIRKVQIDILLGRVLGSFVHKIHNVQIMFVHAGYSAAYIQHLSKVYDIRASDVDAIANHTNSLLVEVTQKCAKAGEFPCRGYVDELFEAGPDRGGKGVGGPFWTDFSTIEGYAQSLVSPPAFMQVVGHTMAFCYHPSQPGVHPPISQNECSLGLTRRTQGLFAVCVDGGMYLGARTFLEVSAIDGHIRAHQRFGPAATTAWVTRDFTAEVCVDHSELRL